MGVLGGHGLHAERGTLLSICLLKEVNMLKHGPDHNIDEGFHRGDSSKPIARFLVPHALPLGMPWATVRDSRHYFVTGIPPLAEHKPKAQCPQRCAGSFKPPKLSVGLKRIHGPR